MKKVTLEEDALVEKLVCPGEEGSDAIFLTGYLARGPRKEKRWRLYKAPELREYVEFHEDDVVHCEKTKSDLIPATASLVWIKSDAVLERQRPTSKCIATEFLSGEIVDNQAQSSIPAVAIFTAATWTATFAAGTVPTATPGPVGGPIFVPPSIGVCGSRCNLCGVSVPQ